MEPIIYIFMLVVAPIIGGFQLMHLFGWAYALPVIFLTLAAFANKNNTTRSGRFLMTAALGQVVLVLSLILSVHPIEPEDSTYTWAMEQPSREAAGFPFPALELPPGALGADVVPVGMWPMLSLNILFWFVVAWWLAGKMEHRYPKRPASRIGIAVLAWYALLYNLAVFAIWYD